jgi:hypothetical protein
MGGRISKNLSVTILQNDWTGARTHNTIIITVNLFYNFEIELGQKFNYIC